MLGHQLPVGQNLLQAQAERFAGNGYLWLPAMTSRGAADHSDLCAELLAGRFQKVHVGDFGETWAEHHVSDSGGIAALTASRDVHAWVQAVVRKPLLDCPILWGNVYRTGEHITWHRDKHGSVQLLLCLRQPPVGCGGMFQMKIDGEVREIGLAAGDRLLFRATSIEHRMTPLTPTAGSPDPVRITAVARYFSPSQNTGNP